MTQKNLFSKMFIALFAMGLIFTSCEIDDPKPSEGTAEDVTIPIDENSAFNMKNFITSFDQMFVADNRWAWNFSHDYTDGKAMTSYQNYKVYGKFGEKIFTISHTYNSDGVITSSQRTSSEFESDVINFTYKYDKEGFIIKLTKESKGKIKDIVTHEYNDKNQLIKKSHLVDEAGDEVWEETFTYNSDGLVSAYENEDRDSKIEYTYSNGNMVEEKEYDEGVFYDSDKYEYDSDGRVTKMYDDDDTWYSEIEYSSDKMTIFGYDGDLLEYKDEYGFGYKEIKSYNYEYNDGVFEYCRAKENDDGNTFKKYYYEGSIDNLQLVGYSIIDSRDENKDNIKTKESVYNASDTKLYYAEFTLTQYSEEVNYWYISDTNWFSADGTLIDESSISEDWVFVLVR